jgi:small subunit ribosomal protein S1
MSSDESLQDGATPESPNPDAIAAATESTNESADVATSVADPAVEVETNETPTPVETPAAPEQVASAEPPASAETAAPSAAPEASAPEAAATEAAATEVAAPADTASPQTAAPEAAAPEVAAPADTASPQDTAAADTSVATEKQPAPKVKLAPAVSDLKAIPSEGEVDAEVQEIIENQIVIQSKDPVEIPKDADLGDLEAEIAAAMEVDAKVAESIGAEDKSNQELPTQGDRVQGIIQSIHGDDVFLDLGVRIPGILQLRQFEGAQPPQMGQKVRVVIRKVDEDEGLIAVNLPSGRQKVGGNWDAVEVGQIVDCVVKKSNKGGLEVTVGSLRGFLPAGQIDLGFIENLESFVGQRLQVKIIEANRDKRNLVVSRRQLLIEERREQESTFWETLEEGAEFVGKVKTIKEYGAFVDLGGADGFLHIGQIAWNHIKHPNEVLSEGQEVSVKVIKLDAESRKISLSMKQLIENPWVLGATKYAADSTVTGKVTRTTEFGAFIELEPGIEGLVHISELDYKRVNKVTDVLTVGKEVDAKVLEYDANRKRVSLSLKQLREDPRKVAAEQARLDSEAVDTANQAKRPKREDLRGGIGSPESGRGLFGNPNDYE